MNLRAGVVRVAGGVVGLGPAVTLARRVTPRRLRVLAYHDVSDPQAFLRQLRDLRRDYCLVTGDQVAEAVRGVAVLPELALWVTFDDGHPGAFDCAEMLAQEGVSACMFVCPGLLDTDEPFWWQARDEALLLGLIAAGEEERFSRRRLKAVSDEQRRDDLAELVNRVTHQGGEPLHRRQAGQSELERWVATGHEIGNHTWDHPCLPRCRLADQRSQVVQAHRALVIRGFAPRFFAYPNGDWATDAEAAAIDCGYVASFLFDHRLTALDRPAQRLSRLRLDAGASVLRARSIASGAHSTVLGALR